MEQQFGHSPITCRARAGKSKHNRHAHCFHMLLQLTQCYCQNWKTRDLSLVRPRSRCRVWQAPHPPETITTILLMESSGPTSDKTKPRNWCGTGKPACGQARACRKEWPARRSAENWLNILGCSRRATSDPWGTDGLCGQRHWCSRSAHKTRRPELVCNKSMHERAVSVALDVFLQPLALRTPRHLCYLFAVAVPLGESLKTAGEALRGEMADHVYKGITQVSPAHKVHGQIYKIISRVEALTIKKL